jgi:hypothetical protein
MAVVRALQRSRQRLWTTMSGNWLWLWRLQKRWRRRQANGTVSHGPRHTRVRGPRHRPNARPHVCRGRHLSPCALLHVCVEGKRHICQPQPLRCVTPATMNVAHFKRWVTWEAVNMTRTLGRHSSTSLLKRAAPKPQSSPQSPGPPPSLPELGAAGRQACSSPAAGRTGVCVFGCLCVCECVRASWLACLFVNIAMADPRVLGLGNVRLSGLILCLLPL